MTLTTGTRVGPYEILSLAGAGGMGEVYKARDTRLDRTVALKVLPAHVASDPELRQRFEREARTLSQLEHPHICPLYDVGEQDGRSFLVMQFLEGETLASRIARAGGTGGSPMRVDEVLAVAVQMAGALDAAHRAGIVHRDLKPGNIFLVRKGGTSPSGSPDARLLDFGLARTRPATSDAGMSMLPTAAAPAADRGGPVTAQGTILGTFQYMAPEQLEGRDADRRTDIFAFGAVLYEMLTGQRAFEGKSQASLIASIMHVDPPPVSVLQPLTPASLDRIVRKCLSKDPDERWQSARDLLDVLAWGSDHETTIQAVAPRVARRRAALAGWAVAAVLLVAAAGLGMTQWLGSGRAISADPVRFPVFAPPDNQFYVSLSTTPWAQSSILPSPDGTSLAFLARQGSSGVVSIWLRPMGQLEARRLAGTEGATIPFWSANSQSIGFFAAGKLKRIDLSGGPPQTLADAPGAAGGAWSADGTIVFAPNANSSLHRVSAAGGESIAVTSLDLPGGKLSWMRWPAFLPDDRHFLFYGVPPGTVFVGSLDSMDVRPLLQADSAARYATGHLLFLRGGTLFSQPFDAEALTLAGDARPVVSDLGTAQAGLGRFGVSDTGVLAWATGELPSTELRWFDRRGVPAGIVGPAAVYINPTLSADGTRVVSGRRDRAQSSFDLWLFDLARGVPSRFTFDGGTEWLPHWSPDGKYVAYTMDRGKGKHDLYKRLANGAGDDEPVLVSDTNKVLTDWTADGRFLVFDEGGGNGQDLAYVAVTGERKPVSYLKTQFNESNGHGSPDGRWMAYQSDESGRNEIYVRPFPDARAGKWQISSGGGTDPRWKGDGAELFYFSADDHLMAASVRQDASGFVVVKTETLFQVAKTANRTNYSVTRDGRRFLVNTILETTDTSSITVLLNWPSLLR